MVEDSTDYSTTGRCSQQAGARRPPGRAHSQALSYSHTAKEGCFPYFHSPRQKPDQTTSKKMFLNFCLDSATWAKHQRQEPAWEVGLILVSPPDLREAGPRPRGTLTPSTTGHSGASTVRDRLAPAEWQGPWAASAVSVLRVSAQQGPGHGGWSREMVWEGSPASNLSLVSRGEISDTACLPDCGLSLEEDCHPLSLE